MTTLNNKQTIDALLDGEVIFETKSPNVLFRMHKDELQLSNINGTSGWHKYNASLNWLLEKEFSTYKFVPEVGQWVAATQDGKTYKGKVTSIKDGYKVFAYWDDDRAASWMDVEKTSFVQLEKDEVRSHKIKLAFNKVGRKQEYVPGDIVKYGLRLAEVKGQYKKAVCADLIQMLLIRFVVDDRDGNEQMMQREIRADEVTPKCLKEHVINLGEDEL
ncbi:hypothetical protein BigBertha_26 [Bacillus phage BigBertha]|uniref:Uncharacterized protein n=1 Tax=Bacillus phage BigBertha TaxID=1406781 RepID=U5PRQ3_9CAUD|nr:hypothetical protein BigBertha_26 [Bacillus phage BigBertha]AGY46534.1 hypothetical protein BigBertha_26 [Bacillus phage BigBertha]